MPLVVSCPSGHRLKVPKKYVGRRIVCPICDARIDIPSSKSNVVPVVDKPPRPQPLPTALPAKPSIKVVVRQPVADQNLGTPAPVEPIQSLEPEALPAAISAPFDTAPEIHINTNSRPEWDVVAQQRMAIAPVRAQAYSVLLMAIASILVAGFCLAPSIMEQKLAREFGLRSPDTWSYIVILVAIIQIALSFYAIRVPDWSTAWLITVSATAVAAMYAAGLAVTMFATNDHALVRQLGLLDEAMQYRAQPWCFFVLCITLILAYCCGRFSVLWHQSEVQLADIRK